MTGVNTNNHLALKTQANFMLKIASKIYGIVIVGALGAPAFHLLMISNHVYDRNAFAAYIILLSIGVILAMYLQTKAFKLYRQLE